ncbi:MAG: T9SS type A sorting domain-containing protein [Bacteroidetes bacterium]|nr:T9SS type A sorting domain-containing protein [Bacteroidota bacterium]
MFRHLGTEGTLGDVGTASKDNANHFLGGNFIYKVFKFCDSSLPYKIYTNPNLLTLAGSNSFNLTDQSNNTCPYGVQPNNRSYTTYECPILPAYLIPPSSTGYSLTQAIAIITHSITYSEFPEISWWMDKKRLYEQLDNSSSFRNSNDTLLDFYNEMQDEITAQISSTDTRLTELIGAMQSQNYDEYKQRLKDAIETNSNIISDEDQEENEGMVNDIYIKVLEYGIDSLTTEDSTNLATLATMCPYIGGTAVYKARGLYSMYQPALMYDDIAICNAIGVYKPNGNSNNPKGIFDNENKYLQTLKPTNRILEKYSEYPFTLYPNPASTTVTIAYELSKNQKGLVIVYDILGREQMKIDLHSDNNKVSINVSLLKQGLYTYKYLVNNRQQITGKLLIQ